MNSKIIIALAIVSLGAFSLVYKQSPKPVNTLLIPEPTIAQTTPETSSENKLENYIPYTNEVFESFKEKKRILYFYANWCSTCRPANSDFLKNESQIPVDVAVFRVNYRDTETDEAEKQLAEKYKITYQHTFVQVDKSGEVVTRWNGGMLQDLIKKIK